MSDLKNFSKNNGWIFSTKNDFPGVLELLDFIIILLPCWSPKDVSILEAIKEIISSRKIVVYVLDIDDFGTQDEMQEVFPGIPMINQTPVVGLYENGSLKMMAMGTEQVSNLSFP